MTRPSSTQHRVTLHVLSRMFPNTLSGKAPARCHPVARHLPAMKQGRGTISGRFSLGGDLAHQDGNWVGGRLSPRTDRQWESYMEQYFSTSIAATFTHQYMERVHAECCCNAVTALL